MARRAPSIALSLRESRVLAALARESGPRAIRAHVVLHAAQGKTNTEIASTLGTTRHAAGRWRARFAACRLAGLEEKRGGPRRKLLEVKEAKVVRLAKRALRRGEALSCRAVARAAGASHVTVWRVCRAHGLSPALTPP